MLGTQNGCEQGSERAEQERAGAQLGLDLDSAGCGLGHHRQCGHERESGAREPQRSRAWGSGPAPSPFCVGWPGLTAKPALTFQLLRPQSSGRKVAEAADGKALGLQLTHLHRLRDWGRRSPESISCDTSSHLRDQPQGRIDSPM